MIVFDLKRPLYLSTVPLLDSVIKIKTIMSHHGELKKCQGDAQLLLPGSFFSAAAAAAVAATTTVCNLLLETNSTPYCTITANLTITKSPTASCRSPTTTTTTSTTTSVHNPHTQTRVQKQPAGVQR